MSLNAQIAVVGAMGQMGTALLEQLAERLPPSVKVFAVDEDERDGEVVEYGQRELSVHPVSEFGFDAVSFALFVDNSPVFEPARTRAREAGVTVVEFAGAAATAKEKSGATGVVMPSAGVLPLARALRALAPLGLSALTVNVSLPASHLGQAALEELASQTTALFSQREAEVEIYPKRAAFNVLPEAGPVGEDGIAEEERFLLAQLPKLLGLPDLPVFASCAYVPAFFGSVWSITAEFAGAVSAEQGLDAFERAGIECNKQTGSDMVTPMDVAGSSRIVVERLRSQHGRLSFWLVADSVRVNAAGWAELLQGMLEKGQD